MVRHRGRRLLGMAAAAFAAGCAVGPDFHAPAPPGITAYTAQPLAGETAAAPVAGGAAQHFVDGLDIIGQWWTLFHSEPLDALIARALEANPDLAAAQAALRVAEESVAAQRGAYAPTVSAGLSPSRNKTATGSLAPAAASGNPYYSLYTAEVTVSYVPDVFGATRRAVESAAAQAEAQRFEVEAAYLSLTANLVSAAVQEASERGQIAATSEVITIESELLEVLRRQYALGQVALADVAAQEAALAQAQQALPALSKQLEQQRDLLAALAGGFPSEASMPTFELATLRLPQELPVSLPSKLVEQRPDVRAASANLHAASAGIGIAVANRLPNITLSANDGSAATRIGSLLTPGNGFWTVAANLTQPIFAGGILLHRQRAAEAAYDQAAAQYRSTVIAAVRDVADTLGALQSDADAVVAASRAEAAAAESLEISRRQLALGAVSYPALLNAEQAYQQARIASVQTEANRLSDTAALFQALGGGWWNRSDIVPAAAP